MPVFTHLKNYQGKGAQAEGVSAAPEGRMQRRDRNARKQTSIKQKEKLSNRIVTSPEWTAF